MKVNEAPEKLYFGESDKGILDIYSNKESNDEVEYTRTDAFIEKAVEWLKSHSENDYVEYHMGVTIMHKDKFIKNFKNYMNEEE
jgi:hypothetical protein